MFCSSRIVITVIMPQAYAVTMPMCVPTHAAKKDKTHGQKPGLGPRAIRQTG